MTDDADLEPCKMQHATWCCEYHAIHADDDFLQLYLAALDVSESIVEPERETPPQRRLREVLAKHREDVDAWFAELGRRERQCVMCRCPKARCDAYQPPAIKCCPECHHPEVKP